MIVKDIKNIPCLYLEVATEELPSLTPSKIEMLLKEIQVAENQENIKCIILTGTKEVFCAGFNLSSYLEHSLSQQSPSQLLDRFRVLLETLQACPKPIIALVEGQAMGGGVGLAAAADVVLATPASSFSLPELLMGILPGVVFPFIAKRLSIGKTKFLAMGGKLSAEQACQYGLVDECALELDALLKRYVYRLSLLEPLALKHFKQTLLTHFKQDTGYYNDVYGSMEELLSHPNVQRRLQSFCEGFAPWE